MKLGFSTLACPNWTAEEMAAQAAGCGYDGAELSPRHQPSNFAPSLAPEDRRRLRRLFADHDLEIAMVNAYSEFIEAAPAVRATSMRLTRFPRTGGRSGCRTRAAASASH